MREERVEVDDTSTVSILSEYSEGRSFEVNEFRGVIVGSTDRESKETLVGMCHVGSKWFDECQRVYVIRLKTEPH